MSNINFEQTDEATELNTEPGSVQCLQTFISAFINQLDIEILPITLHWLQSFIIFIYDIIRNTTEV